METPSYPELESNAIPCPKCGSTKLHFMYYNQPGVARISCEDCGRTKYGEPPISKGCATSMSGGCNQPPTNGIPETEAMTLITQQIEEYKALRREILALPDGEWQARKLELITKQEAIEDLIRSQLLSCPMCGGNKLKMHESGLGLFPPEATNAVACCECGLVLPVHCKSDVPLERMLASMNKWNKRHE